MLRQSGRQAPLILLLVVGLILSHFAGFRARAEEGLGSADVKFMNSKVYSVAPPTYGGRTQRMERPLQLKQLPKSLEDYIDLDVDQLEALDWVESLKALKVQITGRRIRGANVGEKVILSPVLWSAAENKEIARIEIQFLQVLIGGKGKFLLLKKTNYSQVTRISPQIIVRALKGDLETPVSGLNSIWIATNLSQRIQFHDGNSSFAQIPEDVQIPDQMVVLTDENAIQFLWKREINFYQPVRKLKDPNEEL